jgi:Holliday junction resolvasome RuvABC endonuclease subunit
VIALVKMILGWESVGALKLDDTADALALAICHAHTGSSKIQDFYNQKKKKLL